MRVGRLVIYWVFWVFLAGYATTLQHDNFVFWLYLFVLSLFFVLLTAVTLHIVIRNLLSWIWGRIRFSAKERAIRRRDSTTESPLERKLADALDEKNIVYEREYAISHIHVDFAFPHHKLAVECDGHRYHSSSDDKKRDAKRDAFLKRRGWRVLRFTGDELRDDVGSCVRKIERLL